MTDQEIFDALAEIADEEIMKRNPASIIEVGKRLIARSQADSQAPVNQCDGCLAGHIVNQNGNHEYEGHAYMGCQASKYAATQPPIAPSVDPLDKSLGKLWGLLMRQDLETSSESYLSLKCVGVPPKKKEFVAAIRANTVKQLRTNS